MGLTHETCFRYDPLSSGYAVFFCFAAASLAGSVWMNGLPGQTQEEMGVLGQAWLHQSGYSVKPEPAQAVPVMFQRCIQAAVLWLAGMTSFGTAGLCLGAAVLGFSMAAVLSALTMQAGFLALPLFILSLFPQWLFYIPVLLVLFRWGSSTEKRTHGAAFLILMAFTAAGALTETLLNPVWMELAGSVVAALSG